MTVEVFLHYNVLYKNDRATVRGDLETLVKRYPNISLMDLNEARENTPQGRGIKDFCRAHGWEYRWSPSDVVLAWDPKTWTLDEFGGSRKIAKGARELGHTFSHNPARHLTWQGLTHRDGTRHLVYGGHHTAGYYKPDGAYPPVVQAYKRQAGQACVLNTNAVQAGHFAAHPEYGFHHFLIDMNCPQGGLDRFWWLPTIVTRGLWVPDTRKGAIDWIMHSHAAAANGLTVRKRWVERRDMDSDHAAHLVKVRW